MKRHASKSVSFLMELLIVIFFFTIAASVCVLVLVNAKQKSMHADDVRRALLYGNRLIEEQDERLSLDAFAMQEDGTFAEDGMYQCSVILIKQGEQGSIYELKISKEKQELTSLSFYVEKGANQ